jgi:hypothetical protein
MKLDASPMPIRWLCIVVSKSNYVFISCLWCFLRPNPCRPPLSPRLLIASTSTPHLHDTVPPPAMSRHLVTNTSATTPVRCFDMSRTRETELHFNAPTLPPPPPTTAASPTRLHLSPRSRQSHRQQTPHQNAPLGCWMTIRRVSSLGGMSLDVSSLGGFGLSSLRLRSLSLGGSSLDVLAWSLEPQTSAPIYRNNKFTRP